MNAHFEPEIATEVQFTFLALFLLGAPAHKFRVTKVIKNTFDGPITGVHLSPRPTIKGQAVDCVSPVHIEPFQKPPKT